MAKSTAKQTGRKPAKPRPDFPLFPHATGRWAKKIRGKLHCFGKTADDPEGQKAVNKWLDQKDDLLAGRKPRAVGDCGPTIADICNQFLTFKKGLLESGELASRTFERYHATCARIVEHFGRNRPAPDLRPEDFQSFRRAMAAVLGPVALGNEIQTVRSVLRYAFEAESLEKPVRTGPGFRKPSAKTLRINRTKSSPKMFEAEEIRLLLSKATVNAKAMILLGINAALGNTDVGLLPTKAVNLDRQWLDYPREKTGVPRRIPLWPATVAALKDALANRQTPRDEGDSRLFFISRRGESYVGNHRGYRVVAEMTQTSAKAKLQNRGSFYDLRRTFQTVAEGARDLAAVQSIMGHAPAATDMSAVYRQRMDDERLLAVVNHVRKWLFGEQAAHG